MSATGQPDRQFGWSNMFVRPEDDPREEGGDIVEGERATMIKYLRDYRMTLELKCAGQDAAAMARRGRAVQHVAARTRSPSGRGRAALVP